MQVRKAEMKDVSAMLRIVKQAQEDLKEMKVNQWQNGYPNEEVLKQDVRSGKAYVVCNEAQIAGMMVISESDESTYDSLDNWQKEEYIVIHRFAVARELQRQNVGHCLILHAAKIAESLNISALRIDTHKIVTN